MGVGGCYSTYYSRCCHNGRQIWTFSKRFTASQGSRVLALEFPASPGHLGVTRSPLAFAGSDPTGRTRSFTYKLPSPPVRKTLLFPLNLAHNTLHTVGTSAHQMWAGGRWGLPYVKQVCDASWVTLRFNSGNRVGSHETRPTSGARHKSRLAPCPGACDHLAISQRLPRPCSSGWINSLEQLTGNQLFARLLVRYQGNQGPGHRSFCPVEFGGRHPRGT